MNIFTIRNLSFSYPDGEKKVLSDLSIDIETGSFLSICGKSGCGKSTFLRQLKPELTPAGIRCGEILFNGAALESIDKRNSVSKIGIVTQSPDNQIVTDKVWHELAFGLENLGVKQQEIRLRVSEMASFFGISEWFERDTDKLSGGQKQLLNLASIMVMQPEVIILDEPTAQLDPIAASEFIGSLVKINRDLGTTIIISEHRLEEIFSVSSNIVVLDDGKILLSGNPSEVAAMLSEQKHEMFAAMPTPVRVHSAIENDYTCPFNVREGRKFLKKLKEVRPIISAEPKSIFENELIKAVQVKQLRFKYDEKQPDVLKGLDLSAYFCETLAIVGGNGTGKSTCISLISGLLKPDSGSIIFNGINMAKQSDYELHKNFIGYLPQTPQACFVFDTVIEDLNSVFDHSKLDKSEIETKISNVCSICGLQGLTQRHPLDLSGGELQRAALAKVLLLDAKIIVLDEPTKGLDAAYKLKFASILNTLKQSGKAIIMVSHDIEFCAVHADRCAMLFNGIVVSEGRPKEFFTNNSFYTTAANRMAKDILPLTYLTNEIIRAFGGTKIEISDDSKYLVLSENHTKNNIKSCLKTNKPKISLRTMLYAFAAFLLIPLTIFLGFRFFDDRKYYFTSMIVVFETMIPFFLVFEGKRPKVRELVIISVLVAFGTVSRLAFYMVPQFKPVAAIVILSGIAFGAETGFIVGSMTAFVSNYFFGQGPWTPWQMFSFGIIGFLAGLLFSNSRINKNRILICSFGGLTVFALYGGIMNLSSALLTQTNFSFELFVITLLQGLPFDAIHAAATVIFLFVLTKPMLKKFDRIKTKYGMS